MIVASKILKKDFRQIYISYIFLLFNCVCSYVLYNAFTLIVSMVGVSL